MRRSALSLVLVLGLSACGGGGHDGHTPSGGDAAGGTEVSLSATDTLRFEPATVTARAGQKVTFKVTNTGKVDHEFVIGNAEYHDTHRAEASASPGGQHGGHGSGGTSVAVPAGQTASVTFTMPDTAPKFACYVARHDAAGMTGQVVYS